MFRCIILFLVQAMLFSQSAAAFTPDVAQEVGDCNLADKKYGPIGKSVCLANNNELKKSQLASLFHQAIEYMDKRENFDNNELRSSSNLGRSQAAWQDYAESTCAVVAGQTGGAPQWVGRNFDQCMRKALDKRIQFLEALLKDGLDQFTHDSEVEPAGI